MRTSFAWIPVFVLGLAPAAQAERSLDLSVKSPAEAGVVAVTDARGETRLLGRCGTPDPLPVDPLLQPIFAPAAPGKSYCSSTSTTLDASFVPGNAYLIDVWVHVIQATNGDGNIPNAEIFEQIAILNEDFRALPGHNGSSGNDVRIYFRLAGITRTTNDSWFADSYNYALTNNYFDMLAVDPVHYLNIYTNFASGNLGYTYRPQTLDGSGLVGDTLDRVVIYWEAFGAGNGFGSYDDGRTATHEVGHWLGLDHTFASCDTGSGCHASGDTICDTNDHDTPDFTGLPCTPVPTSSCSGGGPTPIENYMNYSDDLCMQEFTPEQNQRIRCTAMFFRPAVAKPVVHYDGFETDDLAGWQP